MKPSYRRFRFWPTEPSLMLVGAMWTNHPVWNPIDGRLLWSDSTQGELRLMVMETP